MIVDEPDEMLLIVRFSFRTSPILMYTLVDRDELDGELDDFFSESRSVFCTLSNSGDLDRLLDERFELQAQYQMVEIVVVESAAQTSRLVNMRLNGALLSGKLETSGRDRLILRRVSREFIRSSQTFIAEKEDARELEACEVEMRKRVSNEGEIFK